MFAAFTVTSHCQPILKSQLILHATAKLHFSHPKLEPALGGPGAGVGV